MSGEIIKVGPAPSVSGVTWDEKGHNQIVQIFISHGARINSIQFQYVENRNMVLSAKHGGNGGCNFDVVRLNWPHEYITWIGGSYTSSCVYSITFGTNIGKYGPFGGSHHDADEFKFQVGDCQFRGFHGTVDHEFIKSIGVYLKPKIAFL